MANEINIGGPGEVIGILSSRDQETRFRPTPRWIDEEAFERRLPVPRERSEIRQRGEILALLWRGRVE
jgi:hypothetical protein